MPAQPASLTDDKAVAVRHLLGTLITFLARSESTSGAYSLVEVCTAPGAGVPPHVQERDDEAFYVLGGRYEIMHNGRLIDGLPGTFVLVRRGEAHAFRNPGPGEARMLILNSPGGLHEGFFDEAGDPVASGDGFPAPAAPDMERLTRAAARHGIRFLPQPQ